MADRSRSSVFDPSTPNGTIASSTVTDAMVRSSVCGLVTLDPDLARLELDAPDVEEVRLRRVLSEPGPPASLPVARNADTIPTSSTIGIRAIKEPPDGAPPRPPGRLGGHQEGVDDLEEAHPAELGELRLVRVEHEHPGVREVDLDDPALSLAEHDRVRVLEVIAGAGRVIAEEIAVQVEGVDQVELGEVRDVDPYRLRPADADRVLGEEEREPVDGVEVVLAVAVGVEPVQHHNELLRGLARLGRVDDERAVQAFVDVLLQRGRVAVVELHPVRTGGKLVREGLPRLDHLEDAVHVRGVDPVEVDRVGMRPAVEEVHQQHVVLGRADDGPGHRSVVGPGRVRHALRDLDVAVDGREVVAAYPPGGVRERRRWIRENVELAGLSGRGNRVPHHRRVTERGMVVPLMRERSRAVPVTAPGEPGHRDSRGHRRSADQKPSPRERFRHVEIVY